MKFVLSLQQNGILSDDCDSAGDHFNPNFVPGRPAATGPMHMDMSMEMGNMGDIRADGKSKLDNFREDKNCKHFF